METPICRHCKEPMKLKAEGLSRTLFCCENKDCKGWHNAFDVPKAAGGDSE